MLVDVEGRPPGEVASQAGRHGWWCWLVDVANLCYEVSCLGFVN